MSASSVGAPAEASSAPPAGEERGVLTLAPVLVTLSRGFVVKAPDGELGPPEVGPLGGLSVGADHVHGLGAVLVLALHGQDGKTVVAMMGARGYEALAKTLNEMAARVHAGEFDSLPVQH